MTFLQKTDTTIRIVRNFCLTYVKTSQFKIYEICACQKKKVCLSLSQRNPYTDRNRKVLIAF